MIGTIMEKKAGITCQGRMVAKRVKVARTFLEKFSGLMGKKETEVDYALLFEWEEEKRMERSIHMLFMKFPIQAVFLNRNKQVVDVATLTPWMGNYTPKKKCQYVAELPAKWGKKVKIGDNWNFDCSV